MGMKLRDYDEEPHYLSSAGPYKSAAEEKAAGDGVANPDAGVSTGATNGHTTDTAHPTV